MHISPSTIRALASILVWLCAVSIVAAAPARSELSGKELALLRKIAASLRSGIECRPLQAGVRPPQENIVAAAKYAEIAVMFAVVARYYPHEIDGERVSQINDLIRDASLAYERAYECTPGEEHAFYLVSAIGLLDEQLRSLVEKEYLAKDDPSVRELTERRDHLVGKLPPRDHCPVCEACQECPEAAPAGYRGLHGDRLALSVGLGGGEAFLTGPRAGRLALMTFRLGFGPRFVLGARRRHVLGAGGQYALQSVMSVRVGAGDALSPPRPSVLHQAGLYLEYGFVAHRHVSVHAHGAMHVSAGLIWYDEGEAAPRGYSFLSLNPGGGAALCTLWTALCARAHVAGSAVTRGRPTLVSYDITLNVDVFRLVDAMLARRG